MRDIYPNYKRGELEAIFSKLPQADKKAIKDFLDYCSIGAGERKLLDIKRCIVQFRHVMGKPFEKLDLKLLRDFLGLLNKSNREKYTQNGIKVYLKRFLKWRFKDWPEKFDELRDIKLVNAFNEKKINENTLLKKEQIESIMNAEKDLVKKTFFITLYESGLRPIELRQLKWNDINFNVDGELSELHVYATKTSRARAVFVKEATYWLQKLREERKSEFLFYSRENKNGCIQKSTATEWVQSMGKKVDIKIFPYLLRHSRATELYLNMPTKVAQKFMGHNKDMSDLYAHISSKDVKDASLKTIYKVEKLTPEKKAELQKQIENLNSILLKVIEGKTTKKDEEQLKKMSSVYGGSL